uniref:uncharacterized protein LOC122603041 n=1 Tax=Erigeron canadensis TaxID=72917 RepID=UPI001CB99D15|nr:uncharacterized protein LOC122603041 [Erigeron canadensis]
MWYEERCKNTKLDGYPKFASCCQEGKILLPKLLDAPEPLKTLLDYEQPGSSKFKDDIRTYNSMFWFTSFGAKIDHSINQGRNLYTFRISGQNYHRIGSLLPVEGEQPRYAQLYFYDTANETRNRMSAFMSRDGTTQRVDEVIVAQLIQMLDNHSSLSRAFRMAQDWCVQNNNNCELRLLGQRIDMRQYNKPTVSEVAVLITNDFGENTEPRDIIVSPKNGGLRRISELHQLYMALQYPLLFPYGETGYHPQIPYHKNTGRRKTKRNTEERLRWTRNHQPQLRAELYNNICDAVTKGDTQAAVVGKRIVLQATFTGSPRYMVQYYQDAMALCRTFGNPDLFITFTANPKWPEVDAMISLIKGQQSYDRSETVTRVFKMKLDLLMEDIMRKNIFGQCQAGVYTIEFQKRGLPHAHILIWLGPETKCDTPDQIDDVISAEMPLESDDPELYEVVTEFMLHGPCGADSPNASCTEEGKCKKHFPRPFYQETTIDGEGYPVYRRRNNKVFVQKGKTKIHNGFVVPYNRYLLLKYKAHINVEWCNRSRAIKYLFKYLNKGPDRATIVIAENVTVDIQSNTENNVTIDEIKNYLDCRYLSPCEAVWRMAAFPIHYSYPSLISLTFHLPEQQMVTLRDSESLRRVVNREGIEKTMFTQWFELNKEDSRARAYTL